ncbi:MAG TPA: hypothetical protein VLY20_02180 [Nitrospiria bacterium]|nr:hypothetical protein [Nitrospiria bacterium]
MNPIIHTPSQADVIQENNRTFLTTFSNNLDLAFQKTLNDRYPLLSLYYRDISTNAGSAYLLSDTERNEESRFVTRQALFKALQDTVNDVNLLYTLKEYSRAMTTANMKVSDGNVNFEGPSLNHAGNHDDSLTQDALRSSLMLVNNADFGLNFQTSFGSVHSNLTYFLAGHDILGASLQKDLSQHSRLVLEYRMAPNENRALLSLHLPFQY